MPKKRDFVDMSNLENTLNKIKLKRKELEKFKILLLGIIIGAIINIPLQLLILPFSFKNNMLMYSHFILLRDIKIEGYVILLLFFLGTCIIFSIGLYKKYFLKLSTEKTQLKYRGNYENIYEKMREFLKKECEYLNINFKSGKKELICSGKEDVILKITFRPDVDLLEIEFDPEDEDSEYLVKKIKDKFNKVLKN